MNDLISREWLIKQLETEKEYRSNRGEIGAEKGLCYALEIVDDMPSAQEWIPAEEARKRLVVGNRVLACVGADKSIMILQYIGNGRFWAAPGAEYYACEIMAWMPLPEPPEEKRA